MTTIPALRPRVLLVEPNSVLRSAITDVLREQDYAVEYFTSLADAVDSSEGAAPAVGLVEWGRMEGLLAEQQRNALNDMTDRLRLVVIVPRHWMPLLDQTDLRGSVAGVLAKPFDADELLSALRGALAMRAQPVRSGAQSSSGPGAGRSP